jgi:hypothetical protein
MECMKQQAVLLVVLCAQEYLGHRTYRLYNPHMQAHAT